jgi:hypothetical protein
MHRAVSGYHSLRTVSELHQIGTTCVLYFAPALLRPLLQLNTPAASVVRQDWALLLLLFGGAPALL